MAELTGTSLPATPRIRAEGDQTPKDEIGGYTWVPCPELPRKQMHADLLPLPSERTHIHSQHKTVDGHRSRTAAVNTGGWERGRHTTVPPSEVFPNPPQQSSMVGPLISSGLACETTNPASNKQALL